MPWLDNDSRAYGKCRHCQKSIYRYLEDISNQWYHKDTYNGLCHDDETGEYMGSTAENIGSEDPLLDDILMSL